MLYHTAGGVRVKREPEQFRKDAALSGVRERTLLAETPVNTWDGAFHLLSQVLPDDRASVVVIDEVPCLAQRDPGFEGTLQRAWDRFFERKPVLLILIGSDLSMTEALTGYGRPFYRRGRAVEPVVREALARLLPGETFPGVVEVGSFWTRTNDVEIDIVGADRGPVARRLFFVGSVKWLQEQPFDDHDLARPAQAQGAVAGATPLPMIAVSRSGTTAGGLAAAYGPEDLLRAWE
ncbi:hypothetical protein [Streptosporangium pseudovulgare]|uniref:DUF234 domain-containing protein n=1 Tax=Streptosporangium pseudovulgare TaxID=35765 RepID=A0ABQ2QGA6_9ACTN|nr:hypothetical protein [Streptosporangium pseudovulgare]GGP79830.1 hypothetical protein GCM10010140_05450 [Streptosporangium pseudovulgare]